MSKALVGAVLITVVLVTSGLVFTVLVFLIRLKTGRSFESILAERRRLFQRSIIVAIAILVVAVVALVIRNNA